jgi:phage tail-like protein
MASTRSLTTDPLRNFKFNVAIQRVEPVGSMAQLGFMQMQGLGIAIEPLTYREGGDNLTTRKLPGQADFNPITLSRGLFPTNQHNQQWMSSIFTAVYGGNLDTTNGAPPDFRTTVYINILEHPNNTQQATTSPYSATYPNQLGIVKVSFKLYSAWIMGLAYSDLDAGGNAVAIEQMTLAYEGFDSVWGGAGYVANPTSW